MPPVTIPLVDVKAQYAPLLDAVKEQIAEVLDSGRFILGPNVEAFEREAAAYLGVPETVGVANGTDALVPRPVELRHAHAAEPNRRDGEPLASERALLQPLLLAGFAGA